MTESATGVSRPAGRQRVRASTVMRQYGIVVIVGILFVTLSVYDDSFRSSRNLLNILDQSSPLLIIGCLQTMVIIAGGFDLSVGAVFALAGIAVAKAQPELGTALACVVGLAVGLGLGAVNGVLISKLRMNTFIATLATSYMFYGLAEVITHGFLIRVEDPSFRDLGNGSLGPVKYSVILAAFVILLSATVLHGTVLGRHIYAIGGNTEAAWLSGIQVDWIRTVAFALNGMAAGLAGALATSRISQAQSGVGQSYALTTIAAVVIGGTSIAGGARGHLAHRPRSPSPGDDRQCLQPVQRKPYLPTDRHRRHHRGGGRVVQRRLEATRRRLLNHSSTDRNGTDAAI